MINSFILNEYNPKKKGNHFAFWDLIEDMQGTVAQSVLSELIKNKDVSEIEVSRQMGFIQIVFAAELLKMGRDENDVVKLTGLFIDDIRKVKQLFCSFA